MFSASLKSLVRFRLISLGYTREYRVNMGNPRFASLSCDFETDLCLWSDTASKLWTRLSGSTRSGGRCIFQGQVVQGCSKWKKV